MIPEYYVPNQNFGLFEQQKRNKEDEEEESEDTDEEETQSESEREANRNQVKFLEQRVAFFPFPQSKLVNENLLEEQMQENEEEEEEESDSEHSFNRFDNDKDEIQFENELNLNFEDKILPKNQMSLKGDLFGTSSIFPEGIEFPPKKRLATNDDTQFYTPKSAKKPQKHQEFDTQITENVVPIEHSIIKFAVNNPKSNDARCSEQCN